jgi:hypothetical protein
MTKIDRFRRLAMAIEQMERRWTRRPPPRKPRPGSEPQPAISPNGPLPMQGGAAAEVE